MGIYCVERVLLAELPEPARTTKPKEQIQHNIFLYKCNNLFWQRVKPTAIVPRYMLKSTPYDIYVGQDQGRVKNLHPPNIPWIYNVNKSCF